MHLIKQNCFLKAFLRTLILISVPVFLSRTNLKLDNISITPKMIEKVITNLDLLKASGPIIFQWWFERTVSLNFHAYQLNSSRCI